MRRRAGLAIVSAAALVFAYPPFDGWYVGWVGLVPLFMALEGATRKEAALTGYLWGVVFFTGTVWWVVHSMHYYGGMSLPAATGVMLLLVAYLAMYTMFFSLCFRGAEYMNPYLTIIGGAALWTGLEFTRGVLFTGFPWALVGYTQVPMTSMIQVAELTGVWGVSFWVVAVNITLYLIIRCLQREDVVSVLKYLVFTGVILIVVFTYGIMRASTLKVLIDGWQGLTVGVAQGNIEQALKWKKEMKASTVEIYEGLVEKARKEGADLVILPETAMPFYLYYDTTLGSYMKNIAREEGVALLVGSPHYEASATGVHPYNSAFLIDREGNVADRYDKVHLVPFGEYVPLKKILFFVDKLAEGVGDFSPGGGLNPIRLDGDTGFGVLICYEAIFPEISAELLRKGASFLVNITNDGWFGRTWGPYQHFAISVMRAVEGRVFVVRAANTGISGIIEPTGRVLVRGPLMERYWFVSTIGLRKGPPTFFSRHPLVYPCIMGVIAVIFIVSGHIKRRMHGV